MSTTQRRSLKRAAAGVSAGMLTLTGFAAIATPATAQSNFSLTRESGADRYGTAAKIATDAFGTADNVLIASGEAGHFADALAGNFLAGSKGAPVLLTAAKTLPKATSDALATLKAKNVTILGGTSAVSSDVENALKAANYTVTRIGGANRYATGAQIAAAGGAIGQTEGKGATAFLASGLNFADALVAGGPAYAGKLPVEVTDSNALSPETSASLTSLSIKNVVIVGGTSAVSQKVQDAVVAKGITVTRLAGTTRQGTAVAVANYATGTASGLGFSKSLVDLATGAEFADALAGGPSAGKDKAPLLLVLNANTLSAETQGYLSSNSGTLTGGRVFGGTSAVSDTAVAAATTAAKGTTPASLTARPELRTAAIVSTTGANQPSTQGTIVRYVFDEAVGAVSAPTSFRLYYANNSNTPVTANSATIDPSNSSAVLARFNSITGTAPNGSAPTTTTSDLVLATVPASVVVDTQGLANPIGDAALGTAAQTNVTYTAGRTQAPDVTSLNFRTAGASSTAVDFVFDQAAYVQNATASNFRIVYPDATTVTNCTAPVVSSNNTGATQGGGQVAGGNGTTSITVVCDNLGATPTNNGTQLSSSNVARGLVSAGAVGTTPPSGTTISGVDGAACGTTNSLGTTNRCNPLEASDTPHNGTVAPDLQSITLVPGATSGDNDRVIYTFDQPVVFAGVTGVNFSVYHNDGTPTPGLTTGAVSSGNQVSVSFSPLTLADVTGGNVAATAVTGQGGQTNQADEAAATNVTQPTQSTQSAGATIGPDLNGVALTQGGAFGTSYRATYTFDKRINNGASVTALITNFRLYLADGSELTCTDPAFVRAAANGAGTGDNQAICTAFTVTAGPATTGGSATNTQIGSATLGTVAGGTVTDGTNANPDGAEATTGGTGTPSA